MHFLGCSPRKTNWVSSPYIHEKGFKANPDEISSQSSWRISAAEKVFHSNLLSSHPKSQPSILF